jgi:hypothetical protein
MGGVRTTKPHTYEQHSKGLFKYHMHGGGTHLHMWH